MIVIGAQFKILKIILLYTIRMRNCCDACAIDVAIEGGNLVDIGNASVLDFVDIGRVEYITYYIYDFGLLWVSLCLVSMPKPTHTI